MSTEVQLLEMRFFKESGVHRVSYKEQALKNSQCFHTVAGRTISEQRYGLRINMAKTLQREGKLDLANAHLKQANDLHDRIKELHEQNMHGDDKYQGSCVDPKLKVPNPCVVAKWLHKRGEKAPLYHRSLIAQTLLEALEKKDKQNDEFFSRVDNAVKKLEQFNDRTEPIQNKCTRMEGEMKEIKGRLAKLEPLLGFVQSMRGVFNK